jgi:hypothetical protein
MTVRTTTVISYCQVLSGVVLPPAPFLFVVLLRGDETTWARLYPARLLLM